MMSYRNIELRLVTTIISCGNFRLEVQAVVISKSPGQDIVGSLQVILLQYLVFWHNFREISVNHFRLEYPACYSP